MDVDELMQVVRTERLDTPVLYGVGDIHADAVVLAHKGTVWTSYLIDERDAPITSTLRSFDNESRALWDILRRLRQIAESRRTHSAQPDHAGSRRSVDFAPSSTLTGAALPVSGEWIVSSVKARSEYLASTNDRHDQWLADGVPLFSRGEAWIVPFAWEPPPSEGDDAPWPTPSDRARDMWSAIGSLCEYLHGYPIGIDLDTDGDQRGYADALMRSGARRADWWSFGDWALVRVVNGEPIPSPVTAMAVHMVPKHWVWDSRRKPKLQKNLATDLSWSWADVVEFTRV